MISVGYKPRVNKWIFTVDLGSPYFKICCKSQSILSLRVARSLLVREWYQFLFNKTLHKRTSKFYSNQFYA